MWIDVRIRKPTAADGDKEEYVLFLFDSGGVYRRHYSEATGTGKIAWMPIPPFNPPEIPEGWRVVDTATEKKTNEMKFLSAVAKTWLETDEGTYVKNFLYITPIEPKYRPFANAAEFRPFRDRWVRRKDDHATVPPQQYCESGWFGTTWGDVFRRYEFEDGQPFGMKVEE